MFGLELSNSNDLNNDSIDDVVICAVNNDLVAVIQEVLIYSLIEQVGLRKLTHLMRMLNLLVKMQMKDLAHFASAFKILMMMNTPGL
ncbi:MAG: hypothetical protein K8S87_09640 [Planctomycetes bacterium]|nr:hypothetical protein [Planctomycetota bacterium]